jgi:3-methylcrotonyl-CoA carboxylase alpha subunit
VVGVSTNIEFLSRLATAPSFVAAKLDTALIERERAHLFPAPASPPDAAWELAARASFDLMTPGESPWADLGGWRVTGARASRAVRLRCGESQRSLDVHFGSRAAPGGARALRAGNEVHVFDDGRHHVFAVVDPYLPPSDIADHHGGLVAPMPGRVLAVLVSQDQAVAKGAPLIVMEAMKMEHTVTAPRSGIVARLCCAVGEQVREGAELLVLNDAVSSTP